MLLSCLCLLCYQSAIEINPIAIFFESSFKLHMKQVTHSTIIEKGEYNHNEQSYRKYLIKNGWLFTRNK